MNVEAIIKKAVNEGIKAGTKQAEQSKLNAYKSTENRLRAFPDLLDKIIKDKEHLQDLLEYGPRGHSKDICRFQRSGVRLSEEELVDALSKDIAASIAKSEYEIKAIEDALAPLTSDLYYRVIEGKYFEQLDDEFIAEELHCDPSTIRKNRGRLVRRAAVRLYGVDAI